MIHTAELRQHELLTSTQYDTSNTQQYTQYSDQECTFAHQQGTHDHRLCLTVCSQRTASAGWMSATLEPSGRPQTESIAAPALQLHLIKKLNLIIG